jgi:choline kinase
MSDNSSVALLSHINSVLDNEKDREQIKYSSDFLYVLRNQNKEITSTLDAKVALYFPDFYNGNYKLETTENKKQDIPTFIQKYIEKIIRDNETQGKNGMYSEYGTRAIATVRAILLNNNDIIYSPEIMNKLIFTVADTLLVSKEGISIKLDAISLLISIVLKFPEDYKRNQSVYEKLYQQQELIECADSSIIFLNLDDISLKIGLQFLFASIGKDVYETVLELMPCIGDNDANVIAVSSLIVKYLETSNSVILPSKIEAIVLQNALHWTHSENLQIRWNAVHILLMLTRNTENDGVINHQLIKLIDSDCVYIKNLIMRNLYKTVGITNETKEYIVSKCKHDTNFVVRMVCNKVEKKNIESV